MTSAEPSLPYEDWLVERLKNADEAAAYIEAAIELGDQAVLMLALRHVAMAQGGIAALARRAKLTREAAYRMLSESGNPQLCSLVAVLAAVGLQLSVRSVRAADKAAETRARYRATARPTRAPAKATKTAKKKAKSKPSPSGAESRSVHGIRPFPKRGNARVTNALVNKLREDDVY